MTHSTREVVTDTELDALLAACRVLVAISARSIATVEDVVDVAQFRALVIVASRGSVSLGELADSAGLTLSTASRMCDRMVTEGLLNRADDPADRRQLTLTLTKRGRGLVGRVTRRRRAELAPMLQRMPKSHRGQLVEILSEFTATGGRPPDRDLWTMGWVT